MRSSISAQSCLDRGLALGDRRLILFHLAELDQRERVLDVAFELGDSLDLRLELGAFAHQLLRVLGVVPEVGAFGKRVQLRQASLCDIPVKDASSAVRSTAWRCRVASGFLGA
jgi:hypothetical protein